MTANCSIFKFFGPEKSNPIRKFERLEQLNLRISSHPNRTLWRARGTLSAETPR